MRFTKKILTMATCAVMAASSMVGMSASAADDHGNTIATATTFTNSVSGRIETTGDVDFFKYTATTSGIKYFMTTGTDSIITVYNSSGTQIASSFNTYGGKKFAGYNLTNGSSYYISVRENGSNYGTSYTLTAERFLKVSHLFQRDSEWNTTQMAGNTSITEDTIGNSGCAITSCAMVINYLKGRNITPLTLNSSSYLDSSNGALWGNIASAYYLNDSGYFYNSSTAIDYLKKGYPVIVHVTSGHYLVAVGYENGKFMVTDAGKSSSAVLSWDTNYSGYSIDKFRVFT